MNLAIPAIFAFKFQRDRRLNALVFAIGYLSQKQHLLDYCRGHRKKNRQ